MNVKKSNGRMYLIFIMVLSFIFPVLSARSQEVTTPGKKVPLRVPKVKSKVKVDAVLDEAFWKDALKLEINYEVYPGDNIKPPVRTEVLLVYSRTHLYAGFKAYDPDPSKIRAHVADRDNFVGDGFVGIVLDTFNDSRRTYNFFCNPFGIQADIVETPEGGNEQWDAIWDSAGKITDWGYCVEIAIPFSSLRFQGTKGDQVWGFDVIRSYPRSVRHHIGFFPRDRNNNCYMCQSEKLIGFAGLSREQNLEITPTLSALLTQEREAFPGGEFAKKDSSLEPGITARWSFTPNLTLSATANPDFSNVEADVAQLDINKQFALYYPEKRPFFMEGASIFNTRYRIAYTRSLADPNGGIKLTGKEGDHALGFFSVHDNITNLLIPGSQGSIWTALPINTLGTIMRYRRDVGKVSNIGLLISDREGTDYYNRVAGIDGNLRITPKDRIMFQFLGSQTRYPEEIVNTYLQPDDKFQGGAFDIFYMHTTKSFNWHLNYQDITPDFRADLGFIPQVDYRHINAGLSHKWQRAPGSWYSLLNIGTSYQLEKDHDSNLLYEAYVLQLEYHGPVQSFFTMNANFGKRGFMGLEFDENFVEANASFRPLDSLALALYGKSGDQIDFTNIQPGEILALSPSLQLKISNHLILDFSHVYEKLNVAGGRLYTANLSNLRLVYYFTKRTFLRTILQYADHRFEPTLYPYPVNPKYRHLFSQILFSYKINPQTVLFLGYSDDNFGFQGIRLTRNNRTIFAKIGYALRL